MATGKTWLELTNAVLTRLRETTVTTVSSTTYTSLIGAFVNEVKREVEDAWDWNRLRSSIDITTVASSYNYILTVFSALRNGTPPCAQNNRPLRHDELRCIG